ncbi:MAG: autotransporter-associated beta strand repeat-containing protein [Chlamydiia bacterium]|nr:autotransporter-associated beta strand repeat-containing protein [Chlamydiia bacterium]
MERFQHIACLAGTVIALHAEAVSSEWTQTATNANWTTGTNWSPQTAPNGAGDSATFNLDLATSITAKLDANITLGSLIYSSFGLPALDQNITISPVAAQTLTFNNSGSVATIHVYHGTVSLAHTISSAIILSNNLTINVANASDQLSLTGAVQGLYGFTKTGSGSLVLGAANTFNATTMVSDGILQVNVVDALLYDVALQNGTFVFGDINGTMNAFDIVNLATVAFTTDTGNTTSYGGTIIGTGNLTKTGAGTSILTAQNTFTGATTVSAGTLQVNTIDALSASTPVSVASGATFSFNVASGAMNAFSIANAGTVAFQNSGSLTCSGNISGTGNLNKSGGGTVTLSGNNTYTGNTSISSGAILFPTLASIPRSNIYTVGAGTSVTFQAETTGSMHNSTINNAGTVNFNPDAGFTLTYPGDLTGNGTIVLQEGGALTLNGVNTYTTTLLISSSGSHATTLQAGSATAIPGGSTVTLATSDASYPSIFRLKDINGTMNTFNVTNGNNCFVELQPGVGNTTVFPGVISDSGLGAVWQLVGGTTILTGANSYTGNTVVYAGTLQVNAANALSASTPVSVASGATFAFGTINGTVNAFNIANSGTIEFAPDTGNTTSYGGTISGTGVLTKTGAGSAILTAQNTFTGATTASAGVLQINVANALSASTQIAVASGATFTFGNINGTMNAFNIANSGTAALTTGIGNTTSYGGTISGTGLLMKTGAGTSILTAQNTFTGATTISAGTLQLNAANSLSGSTSVLVASGATLTLGNINGTMGSFNISNTGTVNFTTGAGNTTIYGGNITGAGSVAKTGSGSIRLTGQNTYTGTTTISAGTMQIEASGGLDNSPITVEASGTLIFHDVDGTLTTPTIANNGVVRFQPSFGITTTFTGIISGNGPVVISDAGRVVYTGQNTYTGLTTITQGSLQIDVANAIPDHEVVSNHGTFIFHEINGIAPEINIPGTGTVQFATGAQTTTYGGTGIGVISGSNRLVKDGAGTLILNGVQTYTGATTIDHGTLILNGTLTQSNTTVNSGGTIQGTGTLQNLTVYGRVAPGNSIGTLVVAGDYTQGGGSTLVAEISPSGASDLIDVAGMATIQAGSTLAVVPLGTGFVQGQSFTLLDAAGGLSGTFSSVFVDDIESLPFSIEEVYTSTTLSIHVHDIIQSLEFLGSFSMLPELSDRINKQQIRNLNKISDLQWMRNVCRCADVSPVEGLYLYGVSSAIAGGYKETGYNNAADYVISSTFIGLDYLAASHHSCGVYVGYNAGKIHTAHEHNKDTVNAVSAGARGQHSFCDFLAVDCASVFTYNFFNAIRRTPHPHNASRWYRTDSTPSTWAVSAEARIKGNYCYKNKLRFQPFFSFLYSFIHLESYEESGNRYIALSVNSTNFNILNGEAGVIFSEDYVICHSLFTVYQRAGYLFGIYNRQKMLNMVNLDGSASYVTPINPLQVDCFQVGLGVEAVPNKQTGHNMFAEFNAYLGSEQRTAFEGVLGLRIHL